VARDNDNNELATLTMQPTQAAGEGGGATAPTSDAIEQFWSALSVRERITLRGLHSSGGIGEVWRAFDEVLGREVALKRLRHDKADSDANRARFFREARLTGQLDHPGIVPVYDYANSSDGRHCYYTMRFVQGRTLREAIAEFHGARVEHGAPLLGSPLLDLLHAFVSVANTVAFAHSRGVIHRDLKSDNVILGDFGEVIVLDWGLAKLLDELEPDPDPERGSEPAPEPSSAGAREAGVAAGSGSVTGSGSGSRSGARAAADASLTLQGELLGTPAYMAPEQALGWIDRIDERTDVYGLAAILYEILTGEPPFRGQLDALIEAVVQAPPLPPSQRVPGVPAALEQICLRGLAKRMTERPDSAAELAAEVRRWLSDLAEQRRSEHERERFFDLSGDLLAIVDREGRLRQSNRGWATVLGWSADARADLCLAELVDPGDRAQLLAALAEVGPELEQAELELAMRMAPAPDSGPESGPHPRRWIHWQLRWLPSEEGVYLVGRDVSERRAREREVEGLLESAPDPMCVVDEAGTIVRVNAQLERMFGYPRTELLGQAIEVLVPAPLRERHRGHIARYLAAPQLRPMGAALSLAGQRRDGSVFGVEISLSPVTTDARTLIACTLRDADARRKLERQIKAVLDAAPDAMIVVDRAGRIVIVNRQTEALFGYAREQLVGEPLEILIPERARTRHREHMRRYLADPSARPMAAGQRLTALSRDGLEFAVEISLSPVDTDDGLVICSAIRPSRSSEPSEPS
jgi:eukaryotic-like serine/threonine-protein kinase